MIDGETVAPVSNDPPATNDAPLSISQAARDLAQSRWERTKQQNTSEAREDREPAEEIGREADAAPRDEAPGETDQGTDPEDNSLPPIEPPRSWTKDEKERFKNLPRELQAYLSERESEREREFRRSQNEAAELRKAAEAEARQAQQARLQYEQRIPELTHALQALQASRFPDVRTWDDVKRMAIEDPVRYAEWDVLQKQNAQAQAAFAQHKQQQAQEDFQRFKAWSAEQDKLFNEHAKEFADPATVEKARKEVVSYLTDDIGIPSEALFKMWDDPNTAFHIRDARVQRILRDAAKYRAAQQAAKEAKAKPLPPVQRPGTASSRQEQGASNIQALSQKLERTGDLRDAAKLLIAERAAAGRRRA